MTEAGSTLIAHISTFVWKPGVTSDQVAELEAALGAAARNVDGLVRFACGGDLGILAGNSDFAILAEFTNEASLHGYLNDPAHVALIRDFAAPMVRDKQRVHLEVPRARVTR